MTDGVTTDPKKRFLAIFKAIVVPHLREDGFTGSGVTYRRIEREVIQIFHVQGSTWGGSCCVCIGIHLTFLPALGKEAFPDPKKISEPQCEFRCRLRYPENGDTWWQYGNSESEGHLSVLDLEKTYLDIGRPLLNRFRVFPENFVKATPGTFDKSLCPPSIYGDIRLLLAQSRVYYHIGNREYGSQFARQFG
jgi:hypothetical protein